MNEHPVKHPYGPQSPMGGMIWHGLKADVPDEPTGETDEDEARRVEFAARMSATPFPSGEGTP